MILQVVFKDDYVKNFEPHEKYYQHEVSDVVDYIQTMVNYIPDLFTNLERIDSIVLIPS